MCAQRLCYEWKGVKFVPEYKMEAILEQVKKFAAQAHNGQQRKYTPEPYIVHPVRVMEMVRFHKPELPVLAASLLHDVLEDTNIDQKAMLGFLTTVMDEDDVHRKIKLVVELTDVYVKKQYPQWNRKKRKLKEANRIERTSADAQTVKYADIIDNCKEIVEQDPEFANRFLRECQALLKRIPKGVPELYNQANDIVTACLDRLQNID